MNILSYLFFLTLLAGFSTLIVSTYQTLMQVPDGIVLPKSFGMFLTLYSVVPILLSVIVASFVKKLYEKKSGETLDPNSLKNNLIFIGTLVICGAPFVPFVFKFDSTFTDQYKLCYNADRVELTFRPKSYLYVQKQFECPGYEYFRDHETGFHRTVNLK